MPLPVIGTILALLGFAAWRDVATRLIPNSVSIGIALLGAGCRLSEGCYALGLSLLVAVAIFGVLLVFHARGLVGGADVKLLTALAFGLSPLGTYQLLMATAVAGGLLALLYLGMPHLLPAANPGGTSPRRGPLLWRVARVELRRIHKRCPLPYGVAIALGASLTLTYHPGV